MPLTMVRGIFFVIVNEWALVSEIYRMSKVVRCAFIFVEIIDENVGWL